MDTSKVIIFMKAIEEYVSLLIIDKQDFIGEIGP